MRLLVAIKTVRCVIWEDLILGLKDYIQWNLVCQVTRGDNNPNKHIFSAVKKPATKLSTISEALVTGDVPDVTNESNQNNVIRLLRVGGPRWRSWLRHCATSQKVAGSIPDGVIGIFH